MARVGWVFGMRSMMATAVGLAVWRLLVVLGVGAFAASLSVAQPASPMPSQQIHNPILEALKNPSVQRSPAAPDPKLRERGVQEWLLRMHEASGQQSYIGTFVVSSVTGLSSARIWHACEGDTQVERVQTLTGTPRSTFRRNDQVVTFLSDSRVALKERRESLGSFPSLLVARDTSIPQFYGVTVLGSDRMAGFDADVVQVSARDGLRFGYRIWSEKRTGLVVKLQTLDVDGRVLEQAAFSDLQLDAPVSATKLTQMMSKTDGFRVETPEMLATTAAAEGWVLKNPVAGFKAIDCFRRTGKATDVPVSAETLQCIFSDGLASVSLFVEPFDARRHTLEGSLSMGATQTLTRRMSDWWLTAMGEVPMPTLVLFARGLDRKR